MKKAKNQENILSLEELSILKGGTMAMVRNKNSMSGCNCDYNNSSGVSNINSVGDCSCTCV